MVLRAFLAIVRTLAFILSVMGRHWRVLSREKAWSDRF